MWKRAHGECVWVCLREDPCVCHQQLLSVKAVFFLGWDIRIRPVICSQLFKRAWKVFKGMPGIQAVVSLDAHWQAAEICRAFGKGRISTDSSHRSSPAAVNLSWSFAYQRAGSLHGPSLPRTPMFPSPALHVDPTTEPFHWEPPTSPPHTSQCPRPFTKVKGWHLCQLWSF